MPDARHFGIHVLDGEREGARGTRQGLLSKAGKLVVVIEPLTLEALGAILTTAIPLREVPAMGALIEVDAAAHQRTRKFQHLDDFRLEGIGLRSAAHDLSTCRIESSSYLKE